MTTRLEPAAHPYPSHCHIQKAMVNAKTPHAMGCHEKCFGAAGRVGRSGGRYAWRGVPGVVTAG